MTTQPQSPSEQESNRHDDLNGVSSSSGDFTVTPEQRYERLLRNPDVQHLITQAADKREQEARIDELDRLDQYLQGYAGDDEVTKIITEAKKKAEKAPGVGTETKWEHIPPIEDKDGKR